VIRNEYSEPEEFLWGDSFWADRYFAETVGNVDEEVVRRYIREQRQ
jgi:REP element-mobilizing transposase RayT